MAFVDYEELSRAAEEQGVPINVVNEWYRTTASNPQVKGKSPEKIVQAIGMAMNTALTGKVVLPKQKAGFDEQKFTEGGPVQAGLSTEPLPTAYAGPTGNTPQVAADIGLDQLKQLAATNLASYRPEDLMWAQEEYKKRAALPGGSAGLLAAGFGGLDVARQNDTNVEAANKLALSQTVGAVQDRQKYATAGIDNYKKGVEAAGLVVDQLEKSGKFEIDQKKAQLDQKKLQLELVGTQANSDQTKRLMDPNTVDSKAVRMAARTFLKQSGMYSAGQIEQMVPEGMSGIQAAPIAKLGGESLDNLVKKNLAASHAGQAAASFAQAGKTGAEEAQVRMGTDVARQKLYQPAEAGAGRGVTPGATSPVIKPGSSGDNVGIQVGGINIQPSPYTTGSQGAGAKEEAQGREMGAAAQKYRLDEITNKLAQSSHLAQLAGKASATGSMSNMLANLAPGPAESTRANINALVEGKMAYNAAAGLPVPKDRDTEVQRIMKLSPKAFQLEVLNLNEQVSRQQARQQAFEAHNAAKGTPQGFDDSRIRNATYLANPTTGESALVNASKVDEYRKKGFKTLDEMGNK